MAKAKKVGPIPNEQYDLPVAFSPDGEMVTLRELCGEDHPATVDFPQLPPEKKAELTAARIEKLDDYNLAMIGAGEINQKRALHEIRTMSEIGRQIMEIEERAIRYLRTCASKPAVKPGKKTAKAK